MTVIRLFRVGKKGQPFYKIVVTDKRNAPSAGRFIEEVGFYNPITKEKSFKAERIKDWLSKGAKASDTVHNLLISEKIIEGNKIPKHKISKKSVLATEEEKKETASPPLEAGEPRLESSGREKPAPEKPTEEITIEKKSETPVVVAETEEKTVEQETKTEEKPETKKDKPKE